MLTEFGVELINVLGVPEKQPDVGKRDVLDEELHQPLYVCPVEAVVVEFCWG